MSKKRVLLVDDSADIRSAVRPLFDSHPKFEVVGEAEHGQEAVEKAPILRPDLIILDLTMPVMNGLEAAPLLVKHLPEVWLILFTSTACQKWSNYHVRQVSMPLFPRTKQLPI